MSKQTTPTKISSARSVTTGTTKKNDEAKLTQKPITERKKGKPEEREEEDNQEGDVASPRKKQKKEQADEGEREGEEGESVENKDEETEDEKARRLAYSELAVFATIFAPPEVAVVSKAQNIKRFEVLLPNYRVNKNSYIFDDAFQALFHIKPAVERLSLTEARLRWCYVGYLVTQQGKRGRAKSYEGFRRERMNAEIEVNIDKEGEEEELKEDRHKEIQVTRGEHKGGEGEEEEEEGEDEEEEEEDEEGESEGGEGEEEEDMTKKKKKLSHAEATKHVKQLLQRWKDLLLDADEEAIEIPLFIEPDAAPMDLAEAFQLAQDGCKMGAKATSQGVRAAFYLGKHLEIAYNATTPDSWVSFVKETLGISASHARRFRTMWNSLGEYVIFQHLKVPYTTLAMYAVRIHDYLERRKAEKEWWSGKALNGPRPLKQMAEGEGKGKEKEGKAQAKVKGKKPDKGRKAQTK